MNTINRAWLKRQVAAGKIVARCEYRLTDDYRFDDANDLGRSGWLKTRIREPQWATFTNYAGAMQEYCVDDDRVAGRINFDAHDFTSKSGGAYRNADGTITLRVHSNLVYTLREIA